MPAKTDEDQGRRSLLKTLAGAGGAAFACALAAPAAVFVAAPARSTGAGAGFWVRTLRLEALREGEPKKVAVVSDQRDAWTLNRDVQLGAVWLVRRGDAVLALSATCPHLGCSVNVDADGTGFGCPCHTSTFDFGGKRTGGPSPRGMDPLETRIDEGFVAVLFRTYRMGLPARVETG